MVYNMLFHMLLETKGDNSDECTMIASKNIVSIWCKSVLCQLRGIQLGNFQVLGLTDSCDMSVLHRFSFSIWSCFSVDTTEAEDDMMIEWFKLINSKNELVRKEADLIYMWVQGMGWCLSKHWLPLHIAHGGKYSSNLD